MPLFDDYVTLNRVTSNTVADNLSNLYAKGIKPDLVYSYLIDIQMHEKTCELPRLTQILFKLGGSISGLKQSRSLSKLPSQNDAQFNVKSDSKIIISIY